MAIPPRHRPLRNTAFSIAIDLGDVEVPQGFTREAFPNLAGAVLAVTQAAHGQWREFARGTPIPGGRTIRNRTGAYLRSIVYDMRGDFTGEVYSDLPYAHTIEEGAPARDAKAILGHSLKVRVNAKKQRFLIIPFRHDQPNSVIGQGMPKSVWDWWHEGNRQTSSVDSVDPVGRQSGTGAMDIHTRGPLMVPARKYTWGARFSKADAIALGLSKQQVRRTQGMVHFRKPEGGPGYAGHDQFITFRVMSEASKGWMIPAQEGAFPARTTADLIRPEAEKIFKAAVEADIASYLGGKVEK